MIIPIIVPPAPYLTNPKALMPLGVLYVAGYVESKGDIPVVIDLAGTDDYIEYTIQHLKGINDFKYIGISATSGQIYYVLKIVKEIRIQFPNVKIIGGGPHFTHTCIAHRRTPIRTQKFIDDFNNYFDVYVLGDGEKGFYEAMSTEKKVVDCTIPINPSYISSEELNELPFPARHLIDVKSYNYDFGCPTARSTNAISIMAQRGCPYSCRFCSSRVDKYSRLVRKSDPTKILSEVEHLYNVYGYTDFAFYDDELNVHPELNEFLDGFKDLQYKLGKEFRFRAFLKSNLVSKNQMKSLKDAGMIVAVIGGESGSDRIMKNINKKSTVEQNTQFVEYAHEYGVHAKCIMSIGHPGESEETLNQTYEWLDKVKLEDVNFTIISCLPSSFYYDNATLREDGIWVYTAPETGDKLYSIDVDFHKKPNILNGNLDYGYEATVFTDHLTQEQLVEWHKKLELSFKKK